MDGNLDKSKKSDNPHKNHRSRLRKKYINGGSDSLEFHEILELLLFYSIPRKDTNVIAHQLEEKFDGSLANIFEASDKILAEVDGISEQTVLFFSLLKDITRLYNIDIANKSTEKTDKKFHENYLIAHFTGKQKEEVVLLTLNGRMERISCDVVYVGSVNSTKVDINKMIKIALDNNASGVIIAHNHPNGPDYPSPEDLETTRRIEWLFSGISINFIDHYVVSDTKISSIKEKSIYGYIR